MNAKERLRAYLEQRRELGESEMMLDALDVDDVMRMLGALQGGAAASATQVTPEPETPSASAVVSQLPVAPREVDRPEREVPRTDEQPAPPASNDWREVMRALQPSARPQPAAPIPPPFAGSDDALPHAPDVSKRGSVLKVEGIDVPTGIVVERMTLAGLGAGTSWNSLAEIAAVVAGCTACPLYLTATLPVPGVGDPDADVMIVGEAPGEKEDLSGEPFVGPAGALLNKMLGSIQLTREMVFISNVLKHRPPGNRNPTPDEVRACSPYLQRQIDLVQPKMIIAFGTFAAQSLLGTKLALGKLRQQLHRYQGIPLVATYHPAALLRNDAWKRPTWEDLKLARRLLDATTRT